MTEHEAKQAAYAAKRAARFSADAKYPTVEYRVFLADGREFIERVIGLSQIAAYWPDAIKIERVDACGGFW